MAKDPEPRESVRSNVFLAAVLTTATGSAPVRVRNLSVNGALIDGASVPGEGSQVELHRGHLSVRGEIAWQAGNRCGVRFHEEIFVREWVQIVGHVGQQQVDLAIASLRNSGTGTIKVADIREGPGPQQIDLATIAKEIDSICERLANSPKLFVELGEELVKLEAFAERIRNIDRSR
jgi:hypothetical protein